MTAILWRRVLPLRKRLMSVATGLSDQQTLTVDAASHTNSSFSSASVSGTLAGDLIEASPLSVTDGDDCHFKVIPEFASSEEEQSVLREVSRAFRRKKYQYDHWDGAIEGYRETEKTQWQGPNVALIEKLRRETALAVEGKELETLEAVHVLDLAADGEIKPHIDSVKFCGEVIAGLSLLSSCVMRLQCQANPEKWITALLPRCSLYVMSGRVRFDYTHAISRDSTVFKGREIVRDRRLSLICRTVPLYP